MLPAENPTPNLRQGDGSKRYYITAQYDIAVFDCDTCTFVTSCTGLFLSPG
jgi:hypothetical protein